jgi:hypothetical protein
MLAVSVVLLPSPVSADEPSADGKAGLHNGEWDKVRWEDNENSWHLYLQHWGRTPIQAMTRLGGLSGPNIGTYVECPPNEILAVQQNLGLCWKAGCPGCRKVDPGALATCSDPASCNKSLTGTSCPATGQVEADCPAKPIYKDATCAACWGVSLAFASKSWAGCDISKHPRVDNDHPAHRGISSCYGGGYGGDWGDSGCPHTEHCSRTYCLQDNLCANPGVNK